MGGRPIQAAGAGMAVFLLAAGPGCSGAGSDEDPAAPPEPSASVGDEAAAVAGAGNAAAPGEGMTRNRIASLLASGDVVFGIFSGEKTEESARRTAEIGLADFVFYSMETGPFDIPGMVAYAEALSPPDARPEGANPHPIVLRIPPIRDGRDEAVERAAAGLDAGAYAIVFPHVETADEARLAVASMRPRSAGGLRPDPSPAAAAYWGVAPDDYRARAGVWPLDPGGELIGMVLIEDRIGVNNAEEIIGVPGVSVAFPGPGDLRRAYDGDMEAVEDAIQTVLAACKAADVPCGVTAGPDDIAARIEQGFRVVIVTSEEALAPGRQAAGR